ncbi:MAG: hypothetical protein KC684_05285 [Candidatus Omnitrophica bacterium]|nr:hypothetical protein [Candidatus Omnitrophota bacterium]
MIKRGWLILFFLTFCYCAGAEDSLLSKEEALLIAEKTQEVKGLYRLYNHQGRPLKDGCLETNILKTCDSDWVTCIDDAWVVEFNVKQECVKERHDGRLTVKILVNAKNGDVISRFPEAPYFQSAQYCLEDYDCLAVGSEKPPVMCLNFIHGQLKGGVLQENHCVCRSSRCRQRYDDN